MAFSRSSREEFEKEDHEIEVKNRQKGKRVACCANK